MQKTLLFTVLLLLFQACSMSDEKPATMPHVEDNLLHNKTPMRINGHLLPPMPDKTLNDKSVAGVDVNHNGVRDDVERWIYLGYKKAIEQNVSMQYVRGLQVVLNDPEHARELISHYDAGLDCMFYWQDDADDDNETILMDADKTYYDELDVVLINTSARRKAYNTMQHRLGGGVFNMPMDLRPSCDFSFLKQ